ncbi:MAG: T9SS type A sorting domain-containing protein [Chitinophagaceae bacterium]
MKNLLCLICFSICIHAKGQFAPQVGHAGTTAVYKDSSIFMTWGDSITIKRGWMDIADTTLGYAMFGNTNSGLGKADGDVISLGDAGEAILYFSNPIVDKPGADFAIFENGFANPLESSLAYLELAYVEVSNDGIQYFRFPSFSQLDTSVQIAGTGEYLNASKIHNLAGKYISQYGTPFDLQDLSNEVGLDLQNIHFVKIIDVVGTINPPFFSTDNLNHKINDPYPTPFQTGGFDFDAIGIIHPKYPNQINTISNEETFAIYPNPCLDNLYISLNEKINTLQVFSTDGQCVLFCNQDLSAIDISKLPTGIYCITIRTENNKYFNKAFLKK